MRFHSLLLIAALLVASPLSFFTRAARGEEEKKQKTELHKKMEEIDDGMKKLRRTLKKPDQNETSLKVVDKIIGLATDCKDLVPSLAAKQPEASRKDFIAEYQKTLGKLIDTMGEMKKAIEAGDNAKALALHKSLKDQEEDAHDKFMESDEKDSADKDKK